MLPEASAGLDPPPRTLLNEVNVHVATHRSLTPELADELYALHLNEFQAFDVLSAENQSLPSGLFHEIASDEDFIKFLGTDADGTPVAYAVLTHRLDKIPWINPAFYDGLDPSRSEAGLIYYCPTLLIGSDHQGGPFLKGIIEAMSYFIGCRGAALAADSCDWEMQNIDVPGIIRRFASDILVLSGGWVDSQHYFKFEASGLRRAPSTDRGITFDIEMPDTTRIDLTDQSPDATEQGVEDPVNQDLDPAREGSNRGREG